MALALRDLLQRVTDELDGDWLLVGGGVVAVWLSDTRVTEDIDLVGVPGTQEQRYALIEVCVRAGVPPETVNSAADYYLRKIPDWQMHTAPLFTGTRGRILRPTTTLFLLLKLSRLTETDLEDCRVWLAHSEREPVDEARVLAALTALPETTDSALRERRLGLRALVTGVAAGK